jgi:hypothetical protein
MGVNVQTELTRRVRVRISQNALNLCVLCDLCGCIFF